MLEDSALTFLISGILLGAGSGITPGPLNTLIISESLKQGKMSGIKIALAPLLTDGFIILYALLLVKELSKVGFIIGGITIAGAFFIIYLGIKDLRGVLKVNDDSTLSTGALLKGIITNVFTPYPHIFWITVGAPIIIKAYQINPLYSLLFLTGFYVLLVGFKILLALFTDKMRTIIKQKNYRRVIKFLGALLIIFGTLLLYDGIKKILS